MKAIAALVGGLAAPVLLLVGLAVSPARAATPQQVEATLAKAKEYLYKHQNKDGNWEELPRRDTSAPPYDVKGGQWGGQTAIATYALMAAGDDPQNEHVKPAIAWLKTAPLVGLYALGMRCQVWELWAQADPKNKEIPELV